MTHWLIGVSWLLAQAAEQAAPAAPGAAGQGGGAPQPANPLMQIVTLFLPLAILFYFMMIRPQRRQQKQRSEMLSNLKKNDHVVTIGGLHATVVAVRKDVDRVRLKLDESTNACADFEMSAIARVIGADGDGDSKGGKQGT